MGKQRGAQMEYRTEHDSMGEIKVPKDALYGAQTQRAVNNFKFSGRRMPEAFVRSLACIKAAAALANGELALLPENHVKAICAAAEAIADGQYPDHFPVDIFQTGSGTSTNMNMNEVLAQLASKAVGEKIHANDDVNRSQSSNDVIPGCIQVSVALEIKNQLLPALNGLKAGMLSKADSVRQVVKTGRTHLMDAMPLTLGQELDTFRYQLSETYDRFVNLEKRLGALPLGGTAVGTGVNAMPAFAGKLVVHLNRITGYEFSICDNASSRMAAQDVSLECSACFRSLAVVLTKLCNDLRWMSSGPIAGLAEIELAPLQPGSSIMPGKVNPVIPEAVAMIAADVMGMDASIAIAAQSGNFQLNVMLPLIADKLLTSASLLSKACTSMGETIRTFSVNQDSIRETLYRNPILVTALNSIVGYEKAAEIAKRAYAESRAVIEVALEETDLTRAELTGLLDPARLAHPYDADIA